MLQYLLAVALVPGATYTVTSSADDCSSASGTVSWAIAQADADTDAEVAIEFQGVTLVSAACPYLIQAKSGQQIAIGGPEVVGVQSTAIYLLGVAEVGGITSSNVDWSGTDVRINDATLNGGGVSKRGTATDGATFFLRVSLTDVNVFTQSGIFEVRRSTINSGEMTVASVFLSSGTIVSDATIRLTNDDLVLNGGTVQSSTVTLPVGRVVRTMAASRIIGTSIDFSALSPDAILSAWVAGDQAPVPPVLTANFVRSTTTSAVSGTWTGVAGEAVVVSFYTVRSNRVVALATHEGVVPEGGTHAFTVEVPTQVGETVIATATSPASTSAFVSRASERAPFTFASRDLTVNEGSPVAITVTRAEGYGTATINLHTEGGSATPGVDYQAYDGTLSFADGQTSATLTLETYADLSIDPNETFSVVPSSSSIDLTAMGAAIVTITDTTPPGTTDPDDDHVHDHDHGDDDDDDDGCQSVPADAFAVIGALAVLGRRRWF